MDDLKNIIESLLFVAEEPLTVDKIKRIAEQAEPKKIKDALAALSAEYDTRPGGFYLDEVAFIGACGCPAGTRKKFLEVCRSTPLAGRQRKRAKLVRERDAARATEALSAAGFSFSPDTAGNV